MADKPAGESADVKALQDYAAALSDEIENAIGPWVVAQVRRRWAGEFSADLEVKAFEAGEQAKQQIVPTVRDLLALDIAEQWTNPLALLRKAVRFPTAVLAHAGAAEVPRDDHARRLHPDDPYDITPGGFGEFGERVRGAGIAWGAAKAHVHLQRRAQVET